jgi:hypothetical protein
MAMPGLGGVVVERDLVVPARDGVMLATDVYHPAGDGPFPVLLERTPYDKSAPSRSECAAAVAQPRSRAEVAVYFVRHGYAVVYQDCRGRYKSGGRFTKYLSEAQDGYDTLAWLMQQSRCHGRSVGRLSRAMWRLAMMFAALVFAGAAAAQAVGSGNPVNDRLLSLPPVEQAKTIGKNVGHGCVGTTAFPMGVVNTAKWKGIAYWSLRCKDGRSFAIQIAPNAEIFVVDCQTLKSNGKECFKKF